MPSKPPAACTVSWKASASSWLSNSNTRPPARPTPASASADRSAPSLPTLALAPANSSPAASVLSTIVNLDEPSEKSSRIRIESLSTWTKATKTLALAEVVDWPTRHFSGSPATCWAQLSPPRIWQTAFSTAGATFSSRFSANSARKTSETTTRMPA